MARLPLPPAESMKLTVLAEIASGGMGSVEMARVESGDLAGQVLAIKRLHSNIANDKTFVDMFLDEAWLTAAMKSPHVMRVVAHGTDERGMFLAVELIEGVPLSRLLKEARVKKEIFSEQAVACIAMQICEGLTEAHALKGSDGRLLGVVHRDLTPGNVLVAFDGTVKIVDFGIAKAEERISHTRTGTMKGKPAYMAPEQAKGGKSTDLRADLFSLGVMLFELLAGRRPWMEKSAFDVIMAAALKPHPSIADVREGTSAVFVEIIDKCLAKKAAERWGSAAEIQEKLAAWRRAQSFEKDDLDELRDFVLRNSQAQVEWFKRAHAGELAKGNAQTFKELEEAIDEARKKSGEMPPSMIPPPNSSGRAALDAMTPSRPMVMRVEESGPATPRPPASGASPTPPAAAASEKLPGAPQRAKTTMPSLKEEAQEAQKRVAMGSRPPPASVSPRTEPLPAVAAFSPRGAVGLSGTIALSDVDLELGDVAPNSAQLGPSSGGRKGLSGTEYMEVSPLKGMKLPQPRIDAGDSDMSATVRMPELSDRPLRDLDGSSRSVVRPVGSLLAADDLAALGATLRSDEQKAARQEATGLGQRASVRPAAGGPAAEPATGLSGATVLLLILVAFLAGGAIAAWFAKTYLMKPAGIDEPAGLVVDVAV